MTNVNYQARLMRNDSYRSSVNENLGMQKKKRQTTPIPYW